MNAIITGERIFTGNEILTGKALIVTNGKVSDIVALNSLPAASDVPRFDFPGALVSPGFIDIHVNGGGGVLFNDRADENALSIALRAHQNFGTTAMLPTMITNDFSKMLAISQCVSKALRNKLPGILGIHWEGPFLSQDYKGTHEKKYLLRFDRKLLDRIEIEKNARNIMTLAPELISDDDAAALKDMGFTLMAGHSEIGSDEMEEKGNFSGITHLFNAMSPIRGREPGLSGYGLSHPDIYCSVIMDGAHVHKSNLNLLFSVKPHDKIIAITDSMSLVGSDETTFSLNGKKIFLRDGLLKDSKGILSGSNIGLSQSLKYIIDNFGFKPEEALPFYTANPAALLGLDHELGYLKKGFRANITILDKDFSVPATFIDGVPFFAAPEYRLAEQQLA